MNVTAINTQHAPETPTLATAAMLVEVNISTWAGRKKDKRATNQVERDNHAASGVANVTKKLLADCDELAAIHKFASAIRVSHYSMTLPWSDSGLRIIPTARYFDYHKQMTAFQYEFNRLVTNFLDAYEWEINRVHLRLGDLFNRDEYPSVDSLRSKFNVRINYMPIASAGDFRVDISHEAERQLRDHYEQQMTERLQQATNDIWTRLRPLLERASVQLTDENGKKKKIYDTLVTNIEDTVELMNACNITNDPEIKRVAFELARALRGVTTDTLRNSVTQRVDTKKSIDAIMASLPSLDF